MLTRRLTPAAAVAVTLLGAVVPDTAVADDRNGGVLDGIRWSATGPAGGGVDIQALAQQAVERLRLEGPDIGIVPRPEGKGLVGLPVWMWNNPGPNRTGLTSASADSVTVTATATVRRVVWSMDDGATVTCTGPGTPYTPDAGKQKSPTCWHMYEHTSAPGTRRPLPGHREDHMGRRAVGGRPDRHDHHHPPERDKSGDR